MLDPYRRAFLDKQAQNREQVLIPISSVRTELGLPTPTAELTSNQEYRVEQGLPLIPDDQICEWCKGEIKMMVQKGTGVCSQSCAHYASNILFSSKAKAEKFGGGWDGTDA